MTKSLKEKWERSIQLTRENGKNEVGGSSIITLAQIEGIGQVQYYISFINNCTHWCTIQYLKNKDEATTKVQQYLSYAETCWGRQPKLLQADNGKEYINNTLLTWCQDHGIEIEFTAPHSPSQNGVAEHFNLTLMELTHAMIFMQNIPKFLWPEVVTHAAYIQNWSYTW